MHPPRNATMFVVSMMAMAWMGFAPRAFPQEPSREVRQASPREDGESLFGESERPRPRQREDIFGADDPQRANRQPQPADTKDSITLTVWLLTIAEEPETRKDEASADFADRVRNLPERFASIDEVRELVGRLEVAGMLRKAREFRLFTVEGEPALTRTGGNMPRIVATSVSPQPRYRAPQPAPSRPSPTDPTMAVPVQFDSIVNNQIAFEQVGTSLKALSRIDASGSLQIQFSYESSDSQKASEVTLSEIPGRKPLTAEKVVTHEVATSVHLKSGTAVIVQSDSTDEFDDDSSSSETQLLILAATVEPVLE